MGSVSDSALAVNSRRQILHAPPRLPRRAEDDPFAWLYDFQVHFGASVPCATKSVALALWARACTHQYKLAPGALAAETGLENGEINDAVRLLTAHGLVSLTRLQTGLWHFYLLPVRPPAMCGTGGR